VLKAEEALTGGTMNRRDLIKWGLVAPAATYVADAKDLVPEEAKEVEKTQILTAEKHNIIANCTAMPAFSAAYFPETHRK
jgi:hypothetical protein